MGKRSKNLECANSVSQDEPEIEYNKSKKKKKHKHQDQKERGTENKSEINDEASQETVDDRETCDFKPPVDEAVKYSSKRKKKTPKESSALCDTTKDDGESLCEDGFRNKLPESSIADSNAPDEGFSGAGKGRCFTISVAVAGSILNNAQTPQLKASLAGQVARACGIYNVDEIIVYDDTGGISKSACELMARIIQYVETPPYLRKLLFQQHPDLTYAGLVAPLEIPHHLKKYEVLPYREGVVNSKPIKEGKDVCYANVGLDRDCQIDKRLPEGTRVTVKFENASRGYVLKPKGKLKGCVVSPSLPRTESGIYWGYNVRIADSLSKVFTQCPFKDTEGYDVTIGTSDKGKLVDNMKLENGSFKHVLIVFGGVQGLEYALENDESMKEDDVSLLFDHYVNTCPNQGARTIRTEEALLISLTLLTPKIMNS